MQACPGPGEYLAVFHHVIVKEKVHSYHIPISLGGLRHWSGPPLVHLHLPLWNLPEKREGATGDREEEL